jgi:hypothetical protein
MRGIHLGSTPLFRVYAPRKTHRQGCCYAVLGRSRLLERRDVGRSDHVSDTHAHARRTYPSYDVNPASRGDCEASDDEQFLGLSSLLQPGPFPDALTVKRYANLFHKPKVRLIVIFLIVKSIGIKMKARPECALHLSSQAGLATSSALSIAFTKAAFLIATRCIRLTGARQSGSSGRHVFRSCVVLVPVGTSMNHGARK